MAQFRVLYASANLDNAAITKLADTVAQAAAAGLMVQNYCTLVAQQPAIVLPASIISKMPPVNQFLDTARANANDYLTNVQPKIIAVVTDVGGYAQEFNAFNTMITGKINDWKGGSTQAKTDALALLQQLQTDLQTKLTNVNGVRTSIDGFRTKLNTDIGNFNTAKSQADIIIGGDQGAIADLDQQVDDLNKKIAGAGAGIAVSALVLIGGALMIAAGAVASFITAGTSTPLVVAGVAVVVVGAAGLTAASIVLAKLIEAKSGLLSQKVQLQADLKFLTDFKGTMDTLGTSATTASTQLTNMSNAWTILGGNLGNVVGSVQNARTYSDLPIVVQAYLNTAGSQWGTVLTNVTTIQNQMSGVKTVTLKNNKGDLGTLNTQSLQQLAA